MSAGTGTEIYIGPYLIHRHPDLWEETSRLLPSASAPNSRDTDIRARCCRFRLARETASRDFFARLEMQIHLTTDIRGALLRFDGVGPHHALLIFGAAPLAAASNCRGISPTKKLASRFEVLLVSKICRYDAVSRDPGRLAQR